MARRCKVFHRWGLLVGIRGRNVEVLGEQRPGKFDLEAFRGKPKCSRFVHSSPDRILLKKNYIFNFLFGTMRILGMPVMDIGLHIFEQLASFARHFGSQLSLNAEKIH